MAATYPQGIYSGRSVQNVSGTTYEPTKLTTLYAEDVKGLNEEVAAIESMLGTTEDTPPLSVLARLDAIQEALASLRQAIPYIIVGSDPGADYATINEAWEEGNRKILLQPGVHYLSADCITTEDKPAFEIKAITPKTARILHGAFCIKSPEVVIPPPPPDEAMYAGTKGSRTLTRYTGTTRSELLEVGAAIRVDMTPGVQCLLITAIDDTAGTISIDAPLWADAPIINQEYYIRQWSSVVLSGLIVSDENDPQGVPLINNDQFSSRVIGIMSLNISDCDFSQDTGGVVWDATGRAWYISQLSTGEGRDMYAPAGTVFMQCEGLGNYAYFNNVAIAGSVLYTNAGGDGQFVTLGAVLPDNSPLDPQSIVSENIGASLDGRSSPPVLSFATATHTLYFRGGILIASSTL